MTSYFTTPKRDVIDFFSEDKELDFSGWDLKKTLLLLKKSNPPLLEWFQSPVVYQKEEIFYNEFRKLMNLYYSPKSCLYHYLHMAKRNHKEYLKGDIVQLKKYFYVLRPVLACLWIEKNLGMVPTEFYKLVDGIVTDVQLKKDIDHLILLKQNGLEKDTGRKIDSISNFLDFQINRLREEENSVALERSNKILNQFFLNTLKEINGNNL